MLSPAERKHLKARAHKLEPTVMIGARGLTDEVVREVDLALKALELIKVRAAALDRDAREVAFRALCQRTGAEGVQHIGKVFVIYRRNSTSSPAESQASSPPASGRTRV